MNPIWSWVKGFFQKPSKVVVLQTLSETESFHAQQKLKEAGIDIELIIDKDLNVAISGAKPIYKIRVYVEDLAKAKGVLNKSE